MFISTIVSRVLQSVEFFRSGFGRWFSLFWENAVISNFFLIPALIYGIIRAVISLFSRLCDSISGYLSSMNFHGIQAGGVDVFAFANSVLPLDECIALLVTWFTIYTVCATIRFVRAAWAAIPLKAT